MGRGALETARALGDDVLIAAAASALCVGEAASGHIGDAREHHEEAVSYVDRLSDAELAPRQEALCHLGWAENYLELYDQAIAHVERGIVIGRATGEGAMVIPMMLVKGFPFEMQGRMAEARRGVRGRGRGNAPGRQPAVALLVVVRARLGALLRRRARGRDRRGRGERRGRPAARRRDLPIGGRRTGLDARVRPLRAGRVRTGAQGDERTRLGLARAQDRGRALLRLGDARAHRAGGRQARERRRVRATRRGERRAARAAAAGGHRRPHACSRAARRRRRGGRGARRVPIGRARLPHRRAPPGRLLARARGQGSRRRRGSPAGGGRSARGREGARRVRVGARARRGAPRAAQARRPRRGARPGQRRRHGRGLAHEARARDRRADHRSADQPPDRGEALPEQEDDRVAHPQPVREAGRFVARRGGAHRRTRPARAPGSRGLA